MTVFFCHTDGTDGTDFSIASDRHGWARIIFTTTNLELTTINLELTTTITTKTTQPLATVSPLNVVIVVICCREKESEDERKSVLSV